jgi:hypothetical protein
MAILFKSSSCRLARCSLFLPPEFWGVMFAALGSICRELLSILRAVGLPFFDDLFSGGSMKLLRGVVDLDESCWPPPFGDPLPFLTTVPLAGRTLLDLFSISCFAFKGISSTFVSILPLFELEQQPIVS